MKSQTSAVESRELQRLRYHQGQTVRSQDFRDQRRIENQLRAWHNRALHNVYGVAKGVLQGLRVQAFSDHVVVSPGLAYDCFGSELLLLKEHKVLFGNQQEPMLLVLRRRPETFDCGSPNVCSPFGESVDAANTELVWLPVKGFSFRDGVALARTIIGVAITLDGAFVVPSARALSRPRIAHGATIPGATTWQVSPLTIDNRRSPFIFDVQVRIDTSASGFTITPEYFATLQGRLTNLNRNRGESQFACLHFDHIENAGVEGFVFRFLILTLRAFPKLGWVSQMQKFLNEQKAYVSWLGIEHNPGDPFHPVP